MADSASPARPVVALLTDFGLSDPYVGVMKGVVLSICPEATLVDITHGVPAQDVVVGALHLAAAYRYFPRGTIFVAVVDPGVGSQRRAIAAAAGGHVFVAPDNGILTVVLRESAPEQIVELADRSFALDTVSRTFEGRDRFAPAAAWIARGTPLSAFGPPVSDVRFADLPRPVLERDSAAGVVVSVDRFGNLITNLDRTTVIALGGPEALSVEIGERRLTRIVRTYSDVGAGELCALFCSTDHLEVAVAGGSAAARLALTRGAAVVVRRP